MITRHFRTVAILTAILAIFLAACGPQETETPEPTEVAVVTDEAVEETEVADADAEAVEATEEAMDDMEATEEAMDDMEATEEAMDDMEATEEAMDDMEATEEAMDDMEATEEAMDDMEATEEAMDDMEATEEALDDMEATEEAMDDMEATEEAMDDMEATEEAMDDMEATEEALDDMEATEEAMDDMEATEEAMDDMEATEEAMDDMEATEEAMDDMEATEEAMDDMEATEEAMDDMDMDMSDVAVATFDDEAGFTFDYPEGYEANPSANAITLSTDDQTIIVIPPTSWNTVVAAPSEDNEENLTFFMDRLGYTTAGTAEMMMTAASINVESRNGDVGFANLIDLGDGFFAVVIELGPDADNVPSADGAVISSSAVYVPPPPPEEEVEEAAAEEPSLTIVGLALNAENLNTLTTAVVRGGFLSTLNGEGPFTVFAPTDDAFAAALDALGMTADEILADEELLSSVLTYHVVEGAVMSGDLTDGMEVTTLNGATLTVNVSDDGVTLTDGQGNTYNVVTADVAASNGVVHIIDGVLLPPSGE